MIPSHRKYSLGHKMTQSSASMVSDGSQVSEISSSSFGQKYKGFSQEYTKALSNQFGMEHGDMKV